MKKKEQEGIVYDIDAKKGVTFTQTHHLTTCYESYEALLADVDAVYIATPHLSHYELTKQALQAKKHVLCEIPLVLEMEQARELYALAEVQGVILMEAHKTAHCPAFNHLMTMIKSGAIGEVVDIEASGLPAHRSRYKYIFKNSPLAPDM